MLETLFAKLLGWIPSPWSGVRLKHTIMGRLCTDGHPPLVWVVPGPPEPPGPLHIDVSIELWVPEHRTTVRDMTAEAAGQKLEANIGSGFRAMTLEPGAKPEAQWISLSPPDGEQLRAAAGDKVAITLVLTRGRPRKLKVPIEPEHS